jgi:hypothetical protein
MYEKMIAAIVRKTQERMEEIDKSSITTYQMLYSEGRAKTELETLRKDAEAAELRRLHAVNGELLEALKALTAAPDLSTYGLALHNARAVIAKAEGEV